jgi:hypothetical protein
MSLANVSIIQDNIKQIESIFKRMEGSIEKFKNADNSDKKNIERGFSMDKRNIKDIFDSMNVEIASLNNEEQEDKYSNIMKGLKSRFIEIETSFNKLIKEEVVLDDIKIENKFDIKTATAQQAMDYGDKILLQDDDAISRMMKKIGESKDVASNIKVNLQKQKEQLEKTQTNLKEIDYSLDRANKTLKNMLKMIATDKIILGMIVIIVLIIIAIIIVGAVGGDKDKNFNVPHDLFTKTASNSTKT